MPDRPPKGGSGRRASCPGCNPEFREAAFFILSAVVAGMFFFAGLFVGAQNTVTSVARDCRSNGILKFSDGVYICLLEPRTKSRPPHV